MVLHINNYNSNSSKNDKINFYVYDFLKAN